MTKLVTAFTKAPNCHTALKLVNYLNRHPMAEIMADNFQTIAIGLARSMVI